MKRKRGLERGYLPGGADRDGDCSGYKSLVSGVTKRAGGVFKQA